jgi:two-component system chemotaxis response regulator CheB
MEGHETSESSRPRGVVAVGGSAGAVEALIQLAAGLPTDLPSAVLVVIHMPTGALSVLATILDRSGPLPATTARTGDALQPGHIYVSPPNHHLLVDDHRVTLSHGPTEDGHRPAINALFRSVAVTFAQNAVGVLLSGVLDDGLLGLAAIRERGGATVAQDPSEALFPGLPRRAVESGVVDHQSTAADMGMLLADLTQRTAEPPRARGDKRLELENRIAMGPAFATTDDTDALGPPSDYTCPDCNGTLLNAGRSSYRCHIGHAWTSDALLRARDTEVQNALWIALRSLQEKGKLSRKLAAKVGPGSLRNRYTELAEEAESAAEVLGKHLTEVYPETGGLQDDS